MSHDRLQLADLEADRADEVAGGFIDGIEGESKDKKLKDTIDFADYGGKG